MIVCMCIAYAQPNIRLDRTADLDWLDDTTLPFLHLPFLQPRRLPMKCYPELRAPQAMLRKTLLSRSPCMLSRCSGRVQPDRALPLMLLQPYLYLVRSARCM